MRVFRTATAVLVLSGTAALASADIAYNNFGAGFSYGSGVWSIGKLDGFPNAQIAQAFQFTAAVSGDVSAIYVAVQTVTTDSHGAGTPEYDLYTDSGDTVGSYMSTWTGSTVGAAAVQSLTGGTASLTAGVKYWLKAREPSGSLIYGWRLNNQSASGLRARSGNDGASWAYDSQTQGAFRIDVSPTSVPEPFTMALMGGAAVVGYRKTRRRRPV